MKVLSHESPNFEEVCVRVGSEAQEDGWVGGAMVNHELEKGPKSNTGAGTDGPGFVALMLS